MIMQSRHPTENPGHCFLINARNPSSLYLNTQLLQFGEPRVIQLIRYLFAIQPGQIREIPHRYANLNLRKAKRRNPLYYFPEEPMTLCPLGNAKIKALNG
jgi:hypothetical protein